MESKYRVRLYCNELQARLNPGTIPQNGMIEVDALNVTAQVVASFTSQPSNDNTTGWPKHNFYSHDVNFTQSNIVDRVYRVDGTSGTGGDETEYNFEDNVANQSPHNWVAVTYQVGFGTNDDFIQVTSTTCGLDMDYPDYDHSTSSNFTSNPSQFQILWGSGLMASGSQRSFFFSIDVPDYDAENMDSRAYREYGYAFTLRMIPSVHIGGAPVTPPSDGHPQKGSDRFDADLMYLPAVESRPSPLASLSTGHAPRLTAVESTYSRSSFPLDSTSGLVLRQSEFQFRDNPPNAELNESKLPYMHTSAFLPTRATELYDVDDESLLGSVSSTA